MANWTADTPGQIDSGSLATIATTIQTTETSLTEARDTALTAQGGITDSIWSGEAATAWVSSLSTPIGKINAVVPEMAAVRAAIATYTTTVEGIRTRATSYKETIVQATLTAMVQYMDPVGGPDPAQQALRDEQHQTALNDKAKAESLLEALAAEREEADALLVFPWWRQLGRPTGGARVHRHHVGCRPHPRRDCQGHGRAGFRARQERDLRRRGRRQTAVALRVVRQ
jgi:hypothetical protein